MANVGAYKYTTAWKTIRDMSTYRIAFWNGWVLGDLAGFTHHCSIRIATEKTVWQMPDLKKGYLLPPGASYYLSRIDGNTAVGLYLALTSHQLKG